MPLLRKPRETMKAAVYRRYGPPEVVHVEDLDKPVPKSGEVLIRVHATTICAPDWRFRGANAPLFMTRFMNGLLRPGKVKVLGIEFAGVVESVGKRATKFKPGDRVFGSAGFKFGAHAQYLCLAEDKMIARMPGGLAFEDAAAIPFGGISALHFLRKADIRPGQKVVVYGASGSVGTFAVQLAKHFGAQVTGVSSGANLELVRSLGAEQAIDYAREDFSRTGRIYDLVFDAVGKSGLRRSLRALRRGGVLVCVGPGGAMLAGLWLKLTGRGKFVSGVARTREGDLDLLMGLVERGHIRPVIGRRYTLEEIAQAHRYAETGHKVGAVVVTVP